MLKIENPLWESDFGSLITYLRENLSRRGRMELLFEGKENHQDIHIDTMMLSKPNLCFLIASIFVVKR